MSASSASLGRPPGTTCAGAFACATPSPQDRHAIFGRTVTMTRYWAGMMRSEEHTSELQSLMRISYAVFCLKKKKNAQRIHTHHTKKQRYHYTHTNNKH